jgi:pyroglutamyl-peptidase
VTLLITGFEPFGSLAENPSAAIVNELSRRAALRPDDYAGLQVAILPTEFAASERIIGELLVSQVPDVLLAVGVAPRAQGVRLERTARNRDDAALPDNAGEHRRLTPIVADGPDTFESTLPLPEMLAALERLGVPVEFSDDAGGYVCNHVFYAARHAIHRHRLAVRCGFIHVPLPAEQVRANDEQVRADDEQVRDDAQVRADDAQVCADGAQVRADDEAGPAVARLPLATLVEAIECCMRIVQPSLART